MEVDDPTTEQAQFVAKMEPVAETAVKAREKTGVSLAALNQSECTTILAASRAKSACDWIGRGPELTEKIDDLSKQIQTVLNYYDQARTLLEGFQGKIPTSTAESAYLERLLKGFEQEMQSIYTKIEKQTTLIENIEPLSIYDRLGPVKNLQNQLISKTPEDLVKYIEANNDEIAKNTTNILLANPIPGAQSTGETLLGVPWQNVSDFFKSGLMDFVKEMRRQKTWQATPESSIFDTYGIIAGGIEDGVEQYFGQNNENVPNAWLFNRNESAADLGIVSLMAKTMMRFLASLE